jgi:hypothetical protein
MYFRSEYNQVKLFMSIRGKIFGAKGMRSQQLDRAGEPCEAQLSLVYPFFCPYIGRKVTKNCIGRIQATPITAEQIERNKVRDSKQQKCPR